MDPVLFFGLNKEEKDLDSPSVSETQLPAWKQEKVKKLPNTQEGSVTCAEVARTEELATCSEV